MNNVRERECMKQIERDIQEPKYCIKRWQNHLTETEDKLLYLEYGFAASNHKITRNLEIIQWLQDDAKKNDLRVIGVSEKAGINTNEIQYLQKLEQKTSQA